jgi:hypothetical protein
MTREKPIKETHPASSSAPDSASTVALSTHSTQGWIGLASLEVAGTTNIRK